MTIQEELQKLRSEARRLRQDQATANRAWNQQKEKNGKLQNENGELKEKVTDLNKENQKLKDTIAKLLECKNKLAGMIFKPNLKPVSENQNPEKKKRGAQIGHIGHGRKTPERIDQEKEIHLSHCPNCQNKLEQSDAFYERIIEDIQLPIKTIITKYNIQRQWCAHCKKEARGEPKDALPGFRLGINAIIWILIQKYQLRLPLNLIVQSLREQYDLKITEGAIQNILHQMQTRFGTKYQELLKEIQKSQVKHADETGWRIQGQGVWCWLFASPKTILYTIEETRGKGVPQKILGENPRGVLVRDDYGAYKHLNMPQQSCWAHLLRNSREKAEKENSSEEMKNLHQALKEIFRQLKDCVENISLTERKKRYPDFKVKIKNIIHSKYICPDTQKIQTRIANQNENLITALLYDNVPLTNNIAERNIRKMVVTRKISGGSQSNLGAKTHAVNLSIVKTLSLKKQSLIDSLKQALYSNQKFVLERTE